MANPLGLKIVRVIDGGAGYTKVETADGQVLTLSGDRNWRNNNPGNIRYGTYAKNHGAIGTDGAFAVFPSYQDGLAAQTHLQFQSGGYKNKTISQAARKYAPDSDGNNSAAYAARLASAAGVPTSAKLGELTPEQRTAYISAQHQIEGFKPGRIIDAKGNIVPNTALGAIDALAPQPKSDVAEAYFKPLPAPAPLIPKQTFPRNDGFNLNPPALPLNAPLPPNRGSYYGPASDNWAPKIANLGPQPVPSNGLSAGGSARNTAGINGQTSVRSTPPGAGVVVPPASVTFTGNGLNSPASDFQRNNQAAITAALRNAPIFGPIINGAEAAGNLISRPAQAASVPIPLTARPPDTMAAGGSAIASGARATGAAALAPPPVGSAFTNGWGSTALVPPPPPIAHPTVAPRVPVPTVPVRSVGPQPLTKFLPPNQRQNDTMTTIGNNVGNVLSATPAGHLYSLLTGAPNTGGGILNGLFGFGGLFGGGNTPAPAFAPPAAQPAPINDARYQQGQSDLRNAGMIDDFGMVTGSGGHSMWGSH